MKLYARRACWGLDASMARALLFAVLTERMRPLPILALAAALLVAACGEDGGGTLTRSGRRAPSSATDGSGAGSDGTAAEGEGGGGAAPSETSGGDPVATPDPVAGAVKLALSSTSAAVDMNDEVTVSVTVEPVGSYSGAVTLAVTGLPADATATFEPATVSIAGAAASSVLRIKTKSTTPPDSKAASVTATPASGAGASTPLTVDVKPTLQLRIQPNAPTLGNRAFGFNGTIPVASGGKVIDVKITNGDTAPRTVHGPGGTFPHGDGTIAPGAVDAKARSVKAGDTTAFYLHNDQTSADSTRFAVQ